MKIKHIGFLALGLGLTTCGTIAGTIALGMLAIGPYVFTDNTYYLRDKGAVAVAWISGAALLVGALALNKAVLTNGGTN